MPRTIWVSVCVSIGRVGLAVMAAGALVALGSCGQSNAVAAGRAAGPSAVPVLTATAMQKDVPDVIQTVGTVEAYSTVDIRPQVGGTLLKIWFTEGQNVAAGDLLFTIDPQPYQVALNQAEATLAKDQAQSVNAETMRARDENLLKRGILAQQDYDTAATTAAALKATVQADQAQVDNAKLQLQYTKITAPVSGRTGALLVYEGNLLRTTDTTALVVINQLEPIRVDFGVPAQYLSQVRTGQAASPLTTTARPAGSKDPWSSGTISFLDNAVDPSTGTLKAKGTFANTDRKLWPGELVEVALQLGVATKATVVPATAVQNGQQGQYVYVVKPDHTVAFRPVETTLRNGDDVVVSNGLKVGEEVVTDGQLALTPGAKIQIKNTGSAARGTRP